MSEAWIPVVYALIGAAASAFGAWVSAKYAVKKVEDKVSAVAEQNTQQSGKIDSVHQDLNGRLTEWRAEVRVYIETAVKAALAEGKATGVEQERTRVEKKEKE